MSDLYVVRPDSRGGFALSGPRLVKALWYLDETHAVSYAQQMLRDRGGRTAVLTSSGRCEVVEWTLREDDGLRPCGGSR